MKVIQRQLRCKHNELYMVGSYLRAAEERAGRAEASARSNRAAAYRADEAEVRATRAERAARDARATEVRVDSECTVLRV